MDNTINNSSPTSESFKDKLWAGLLFLLIIILTTIALYFFWSFTHVKDHPADIFQMIAVSIITTWIVFLIAYFLWAIHFYNINMGWTDKDWERNREKKQAGTGDAEREPISNPNAGESLGMPPGTIRATIALTILIAGLAMTIASFSMDSTYPPNAMFIDRFDFFKTAFLMMIAFYFGTKSLDILMKPKLSGKEVATQSENTTDDSSENTKAAPSQI